MGKQVKCPICGKELAGGNAAEPFAPFCSARCQKADLGRWFDEAYSVPVETRRVARQHAEQERNERRERSYRTEPDESQAGDGEDE